MGITPQNEEVLEKIKETCESATKPLAHVAKFGAKEVRTFIFDIDRLPEFPSEGIRTHAAHQTVFDQIAAIKGPVVYVFEIISAHSSETVRAAARSYDGPRAMPAFRKESKTDYTSRVLYVGKVKMKAGFLARVIQHLGFWGTEKTQGMQLCHYACGLDLKLELTVFEFEADMADLLPLLEKAVASQLKPLLGKHQ